jgi:hypothetical protein
MVAAGLLLVWLGTGSVACALTILASHPKENTLAQFGFIGERPPGIGTADEYYAQTFITPSVDTLADNFTFYPDNNTESPYFGMRTDAVVPLRVLITKVIHDATGIRPGDIVFETTTSIPYTHGVSGLKPVTVDFPEVSLEPSTEYAVVLDAASDLNLSDDIAARALVWAELYDSGTFFYYRVQWEDTGGVVGSRESHFAANWAEHPNFDMKFSMTFVPEPSTCALVLLSVPALFGLRRRRR